MCLNGGMTDTPTRHDRIVGIGTALAILLILAFVLTGWPIR